MSPAADVVGALQAQGGNLIGAIQTLAEREVELKTARDSLSEHAKKELIASEHQSILERIEHFFGI